MRKTIFAIGALLMLTATACERDPYPLDLARYDVYWYDDDRDGYTSMGDEFQFIIRVNTTDPDPENQFITEWEFAYFVNGQFAGVLDGDEGIRSNSINMDGLVRLAFLDQPGPGVIDPGDRLEFRFWAVDNWGTQLERTYEVVVR